MSCTIKYLIACLKKNLKLSTKCIACLNRSNERDMKRKGVLTPFEIVIYKFLKKCKNSQYLFGLIPPGYWLCSTKAMYELTHS